MSDPTPVCLAMDLWAKACMTDLPTDADYTQEWRQEFREHWNFIRLAISKSCLLDRLIYGGETLRTRMCPLHKGKWGGCTLEECPHGCSHGICITGWIRNPDDPQSGNTGIAIVTAQEKEPHDGN